MESASLPSPSEELEALKDEYLQIVLMIRRITKTEQPAQVQEKKAVSGTVSGVLGALVKVISGTFPEHKVARQWEEPDMKVVLRIIQFARRTACNPQTKELSAPLTEELQVLAEQYEQWKHLNALREATGAKYNSLLTLPRGARNETINLFATMSRAETIITRKSEVMLASATHLFDQMKGLEEI